MQEPTLTNEDRTYHGNSAKAIRELRIDSKTSWGKRVVYVDFAGKKRLKRKPRAKKVA